MLLSLLLSTLRTYLSETYCVKVTRAQSDDNLSIEFQQFVYSNYITVKSFGAMHQTFNFIVHNDSYEYSFYQHSDNVNEFFFLDHVLKAGQTLC